MSWYLFYISLLFNGLLLAGLVWLWIGKQRPAQRASGHSKDSTRQKELSDTDSSRNGSHKFEMVTVLFCDIEGFTKIAEQLNPEVLIDKLDEFYLYFDSVIEKYDIEKIKTIGDAYMCASGIPRKNTSNPLEILLAALEIQRYMTETRRSGITIWDIRIGIHTGPAITAVLGKKKLTYDIWGDTVNIASRMESSGEPGEINISSNTFQHIAAYCDCTYRGKMPVKYKGELDMYFVRGLKPQWSAGSAFAPNRDLLDTLQLTRLSDYEEDIFAWTLNDIPGTFHFHNLRYAYDVYLKADMLARAEGLGVHDTLLVRTAAAFFMLYYCRRQPDCTGCELEKLPLLMREIRLSESTIAEVMEFLRATFDSSTANGLREEVFHDALYDYFGRADFADMLHLLYSEHCARFPETSLNTWIANQFDFYRQLRFFTSTARQLSEIPRERQLEVIQLFTPEA